MSDLVPADKIETIVGVNRHRWVHYGRAVSAQQTVYVLHSRKCVDSGIDLRRCPFSRALDRGIDSAAWAGHEDTPVILAMQHGRLVPDVTEVGR